MSSAICQNFVQNAWKKELCSNCFKSKDEHLKRAAAKAVKAASTLILNQPKNSIIRSNNKLSKPKRNVNFTKELTQVIGFGGEDWSSDQGDDEEEEPNDNNEADDECQSSEDDERELQRLTKANTDFNANSLNVSSETKKSYAQLKLGKPQYDSDGKKQSLVISVTPFGEEKKSSLGLGKSHIPIIAKTKDSIIENKNNIVLTSYTSKSTELKEEKSLLEEITETLEKSKNPIQIITRKKTQKDIVLAIPEKKTTTIEEPKLVKNIIPERKNGLSRNGVVKREEKPVVYQSSAGKIEVSAKKMIFSKVKEDNTDESNTSSSDDASIDGEKTGVSAFSREQVGEPDGKADSDNSNEAPSLPLTLPPALDTPVTSPEKPKIPNKPSTILIRKNPHQFIQPTQQEPSNVLTSFMSEAKPTCQLVKRDSNGSDIALKSVGNFFLNNNKRKAPKPPNPTEDIGIYTKNNLNGSLTSDCPVVREKEKRERASSCSPKLRNDGTDSTSICDDPQGENSSIGSDTLDSSIPAPAPRRSLSLSTDSLANGEVKKDKNRPRFSLKKFLRISSGKELPKAQLDVYRSEQDLRPQPKPRLEIVHPLDLNGRSVEVLNKDHQQDNKVTEIYLPRIQIVANPALTSINPVNNKPSPPPRSNHLLNEDAHKPVLPHPPKSAEILTKQRQVQLNNIKNNPNRPKTDSVYANIGEVRSAIAPNKPQRTASMRDRENQPPLLKSSSNKENLYEYVISGNTTVGSNRSSSPEADSSTSSGSSGGGSGGKSQLQVQLRAEGTGAEYYKGSYAQQMPRSVSLTYCGSETESEIYAPYSYYGSESEIAEDENEWNNSTGRTHKLRSRKGRSIVHRNLEDNYGAVVIANHEALAQVLENIQHNNNTFIPLHLRPLKSSPTLRFTDFSLSTPTASPSTINVGRYTFRTATYCNQPVTLSIVSSAGGGPARGGSGGTLLTTSMLAATGLTMPTVVEFSDVVPREEVVVFGEDAGEDLLKEVDVEKESMVQATIAVLPLLQLTTMQSYGVQQQSKPIPSNQPTINNNVGRLDDISKDAVFVLLQLVNALKTLQAQGIEELPLSLDTFVLAKDADRDVYYRLYVLQGSSSDEPSNASTTSGSLCSCAASALSLLRPAAGRLYPLLHRLLDAERAVCLTQVRSVLEFSLWGPSDVTLGNSVRERELALQRWLDLQRATVLHGLVCTKVQLTVYEECHLLFLVRSNAKMLCDASLLLDSVTAAQQTKA